MLALSGSQQIARTWRVWRRLVAAAGGHREAGRPHAAVARHGRGRGHRQRGRPALAALRTPEAGRAQARRGVASRYRDSWQHGGTGHSL